MDRPEPPAAPAGAPPASGQCPRESNPGKEPVPERAVALSIGLPRDAWDSPTTRSLVVWQGVYSLAGLLCGFAAMMMGTWIASQSIAGDTKWDLSVLGLQMHLSGATPGVVLAIVGLLAVFFTRFHVSAIKDRIAKPPTRH